MIEAPDGPLFRGLYEAPSLRDTAPEDGGDSGDTAAVDSLMSGHFAVFDTWTEIHSWYEGDFVERIAPGAFKRTIKNNADQVKVQFDHGYDMYVCDAPLGPIDVLREDDIGAYFEVPLYDTDYNRDRLLPLLQGRLMNGEMRGSGLGASFRFRVVTDSWVREPKASTYNPDALPERTITELRLFEFGPVVFPAYPEATAECGGRMRSLTDFYLDRTREARSSKFSLSPASGTDSTPTTDPARSHSEEPRGLSLAVATTHLLARKARP